MAYTRRLSVQATSVEFINLDESDEVAAAGGTKDLELAPPEGYHYKLHAMMIKAPIPIGGGSGTHNMRIQNSTKHLTHMFMSEVYGTAIEWQYNMLYSGGTVIPADVVAMQAAIDRILITSARPLIITYTNSTDVSQTGQRDYRFEVVKIKVD